MIREVVIGGLQAWLDARKKRMDAARKAQVFSASVQRYGKMLRGYKYVHVMNNGIHSEVIYRFLSKHFDQNEHCFIFPLMHEATRAKFQQYRNCFNAPLQSIPIDTVSKIVFHGLFTRGFIEYLFDNDEWLAKCYWFIWGGDLYCDDDDIAKFVKSRMRGILTTFDKEEYERRFGRNQVFDVSYPGYMDSLMPSQGSCEKSPGSPTVIMVNNCADDTTFAMLDTLYRFVDENIRIRLVLSYSTVGQADCRKELLEKGRELFGDKLDAITEFLPPEEYVKVLASVDIYISNQDRQQGNGNASFLCSIGRKVFMRSCSSVYKTYNGLGIRYFDTDTIPRLSFAEFVAYDPAERNRTIERLRQRMSDENKISQWRSFFDHE